MRSLPQCLQIIASDFIDSAQNGHFLSLGLEGTYFNCYFQRPVSKTSKDLILEFKYNKDYDNFVRNNLQKISVRYSKNSKYVNFFMENNCIY